MPHIATTLAYVRTPSGVVRVVAGDHLPSDTEEADVQRLVAAGAATKTRTRKSKADADS